MRLSRERTKWWDRVRVYTIVLDGADVGTIANGETKSVPVSPGEHTLRVKIDWTGSTEERFGINAGETIDFTCKTETKFPLWSLIESIRHRDRWVILRRT